MTLLGKNKKLRFAIRGPTSQEWMSGRWTSWLNGRDVYIAPSSSGHVKKISLHESGECRYAVTTNAFSHMRDSLDVRVINKWQRGDFRKIDHTHVMSMHFLIIGSGFPEQVIDKKETYLLPAAPLGFSTEVAVFFSETNPLDWRSKVWLSSNIMGVWRLADSEFVAFRTRVSPFPDARLQEVLSSSYGMDQMHIGESSSNIISAGHSSCIVSWAYSNYTEFFVLEKVSTTPLMGISMKGSKPVDDLRIKKE